MFSSYLFHPSSLGLLMTDSRTKDPLGETCKAHLMECYVSKKYDRYKDVTNKYIEKGLLAEEDSIDLYSLVKGSYFEKNKETIENEYFVGTPDLFVGTSIREAQIIIDLKTNWDIFTFFQVMHKSMDKKYYWQLQAYMDLTGAKIGKLVYCLVDTPLKLIEDEKRKLMYNMGVIDAETNEEYQKACERIQKNGIYSLDIPKEERYIEFTIPRDQDRIEEAHERVKVCREFLNEFSTKH